MVDLLVTNIGMLATPTGNTARCGKTQGDILILTDAAVAVQDGAIHWVGNAADAPVANRIINAGGKLVTPGLIDCHTHLVFGGWRQHEMAQKLAGASYLDILKSGGGILSTVNATRDAAAEDLYKKGRAVLDEMLSYGVTTCEAKSGYGLATDAEIKQLNVIRELNRDHAVNVVATFMGAHALPPEYAGDRAGYVSLICEDMIPQVAEQNLASFCDVFCESGVFTVEESRRILEAAKKHGLLPKIHADEIESIGGSGLAAEVGAVSAEHLICSTESDIQVMSNAGVIGVLLPTTSFYLDKPYAKAQDMISADMAVAVATDFNPGSSPNCNLQLSMTMACLKYKMTPQQVLTAVTLNAAAAIDRANNTGSVEYGKKADLAIWNAPDLDYIFYRLGSNLVHTVIKNGEEIR